MTQQPTYYKELIDLQQVDAVEQQLQQLVDMPIASAADLASWLEDEKHLLNKIYEAIIGHQVDFYRNTEDADVKATYLHDQQVMMPLLMTYAAKLDEKFCTSPFIGELDEARYGLLRRVRETKIKLFREENIPLFVKEQELSTKYDEIMGSLTIEWNGEEKPLPFIDSQLDNLDRSIREQAYRKKFAAFRQIKPDIDAIMDELIQVRHQIATNAGFANYRDYMFVAKNREYTIEQCYDFHDNVATYIIPAWNRLAAVFQQELGVDTYRPWDNTAKLMKQAPYTDIDVLMDGMHEMLGEIDAYFAERFQHMRDNGLLDLGDRKGKGQGGFCTGLPISGDTFVFANFSPSFFSLIALIHEMGHAVNGYLQFDAHGPVEDFQMRSEIAELYSHGMELLMLDKLDRFYTQ